MVLCPVCHAELPDDAVLCVDCGYHIKEGKYLASVVDDPGDQPELPTDDDNPYRSPSDSTSAPDKKSYLTQNYDMKTRVEFLEQRVRDLEQRIDSTRLLAPEFFTRLLAVCGYAVIGYLAVMCVFSSITVLVRSLISL